MKTYKIMLQSASDIITNSSSEIYTIKSGVGEDFLRSWWDAKLKGTRLFSYGYLLTMSL